MVEVSKTDDRRSWDEFNEWDIDEFDLNEVREQFVWFPATPYMVKRLKDSISLLLRIRGHGGSSFLRNLGDLEKAFESFSLMRASAVVELTALALSDLRVEWSKSKKHPETTL
jgi:hypothetical protein